MKELLRDSHDPLASHGWCLSFREDMKDLSVPHYCRPVSELARRLMQMSMLTVSQKILREEWDMLLGDLGIGQLTEGLASLVTFYGGINSCC